MCWNVPPGFSMIMSFIYFDCLLFPYTTIAFVNYNSAIYIPSFKFFQFKNINVNYPFQEKCFGSLAGTYAVSQTLSEVYQRNYWRKMKSRWLKLPLDEGKIRNTLTHTFYRPMSASIMTDKRHPWKSVGIGGVDIHAPRLGLINRPGSSVNVLRGIVFKPLIIPSANTYMYHVN